MDAPTGEIPRIESPMPAHESPDVLAMRSEFNALVRPPEAQDSLSWLDDEPSKTDPSRVGGVAVTAAIERVPGQRSPHHTEMIDHDNQHAGDDLDEGLLPGRVEATTERGERYAHRLGILARISGRSRNATAVAAQHAQVRSNIQHAAPGFSQPRRRLIGPVRTYVHPEAGGDGLLDLQMRFSTANAPTTVISTREIAHPHQLRTTERPRGLRKWMPRRA